ncbi:MAG: extracellular solute-binding protein [Chloroflexi bacterium]|nr:extracellular solute-binding protein [Chloroflexota bacterium]
MIGTVGSILPRSCWTAGSGSAGTPTRVFASPSRLGEQVPNVIPIGAEVPTGSSKGRCMVLSRRAGEAQVERPGAVGRDASSGYVIRAGWATRRSLMRLGAMTSSWGPELPLPFTAGPGINNRLNWNQVAGQFASAAASAGGAVPTPGTGNPTPVPTDKLLEQQISTFTSEREDVNVTIMTERFDRYNDKLMAFAASGQMPDVVVYDGPNALPLLKAGAFYPLQRLQGASGRAFLADYQPGYLDASAFRGRLFGLPYQARQLVLYVNKSAFSGLSLPPATWGSPDWTWGHFLRGFPPVRHVGDRPAILGVTHPSERGIGVHPGSFAISLRRGRGA